MTRYLIDTNILLRAVQPESDHFKQAVDAVRVLLGRGDVIYITPQVIIEFWSVATRPSEVNGLGWSPDEALRQINHILLQFLMLSDDAAVFAEWLQLVQRYRIHGKKAHDARLAAVMLVHGVDHLLTFNVDDFKAYEKLKAVHPTAV